MGVVTCSGTYTHTLSSLSLPSTCAALLCAPYSPLGVGGALLFLPPGASGWPLPDHSAKERERHFFSRGED